MHPTDTIVAPATAPGAAAVAIVRVSGPDAWPLVRKLVPSFRADGTPRLAVTGRLETPDGVRDDVLLLPFRGPRSYTGEDLIELHLHGNDLIVSAVLRTLAGWGARPAGPGEFTQRAFLNGKLDLTQAEAVGELIAAKSARMAEGAAVRLAGGLSEKYQRVRRGLLEVLVHLEATIDFPDEDIETLGYPRLLADIDRIGAELKTLEATFDQGRVERDGLRVAIAGRPNAGKSSLLNSLLGVERAIVTPHAGTTRDYLEESLALGGAAIQLLDTAGLRETNDPIEAEGIRRAKAKLAEADVLLYIVDGTQPLDPVEVEEAIGLGVKQLVWVINKSDLTNNAPLPGNPAFLVSAKTGEGLPALLSFLANSAAGGDSDVGLRVVSARQQRLVSKAAESLAATAHGLRTGVPPELAVEDLRQAVQAAGELTGDIVNDEVLGEIFSRFCIGK
jgi:tRNA modification GTPase